MAELIVRMSGKSNGVTATYEYEFRSSSSEGGGPLEQEYVVEPNPALIHRLCDKIDNIVEDALGPTPTSADPVAELTRTSRLLHDNLFPGLDGTIPELARRLRRCEEPLLIRTNEARIPWELLHDGTEFLGLTHELGKRTFVANRIAGGRTISSAEKALIVGDPTGDLPSARREAEQLAGWLRRHGVECTVVLGAEATLVRVIDELTYGGYDLLHYCGHVAAPHGTQHVGLRLHQDELLDGRALTPLGKVGVPPIVFINGCASADRVKNLCVSFMVVGAKIVIGTRYAVEEESARRFAERFYTDLIRGVSAGASMRAARQGMPGVEWAAFTLYGDPSVRISKSAQPPPAPEPRTIDHRLGPDAKALIDRSIQRVGGRGLVTSLDLLVELLSTKTVAENMKDDLDAERLLLAKELLRTVLHLGPVMPDSGSGEVEFSDTVQAVLARAHQLAEEAGRDLTTEADVLTAFVAVGGGSSRQIMELFGLELSALTGPATAKPPTRQPAARQPSAQPPSSTNGQVVTSVLFDEDGKLRAGLLHPTVAVAIRVATILASAQRTVISQGLLLYGLAVADSAVLARALREQGEPGEEALRRLSFATGIGPAGFSPRTRRALERAAQAAEHPVDDAAVLAELLADRTSSAWHVLTKLGVDPAKLIED